MKTNPRQALPPMKHRPTSAVSVSRDDSQRLSLSPQQIALLTSAAPSQRRLSGDYDDSVYVRRSSAPYTSHNEEEEDSVPALRFETQRSDPGGYSDTTPKKSWFSSTSRRKSLQHLSADEDGPRRKSSWFGGYGRRKGSKYADDVETDGEGSGPRRKSSWFGFGRQGSKASRKSASDGVQSDDNAENGPRRKSSWFGGFGRRKESRKQSGTDIFADPTLDADASEVRLDCCSHM